MMILDPRARTKTFKLLLSVKKLNQRDMKLIGFGQGKDLIPWQ